MGQVTKVEVKQSTPGEHAWTPAFIKVNTNDAKTGIGNGVFYITTAHNAIDESNPIMSTAESGVSLEKCNAQFCEERMDKKMQLMHEKELSHRSK